MALAMARCLRIVPCLVVVSLASALPWMPNEASASAAQRIYDLPSTTTLFVQRSIIKPREASRFRKLPYAGMVTRARGGE